MKITDVEDVTATWAAFNGEIYLRLPAADGPEWLMGVGGSKLIHMAGTRGELLEKAYRDYISRHKEL